MTTQHAPHTPLSPTPLWRQVLSLPKTGLGWTAVVLGVPLSVPIVLGSISNILPGAGILDSDPPGFLMLLMATSLFAGLFGGLVAATALVGGHERSWLVWAALVPMLLVFSGAISPLVALLHAGSVATGILAFLIWVLIVAGIAFWIGRADSRESR